MTKKTKIIIGGSVIAAAAAYYFLLRKKTVPAETSVPQTSSTGSIPEAQALIKPGLATQSIVRVPHGSTRMGNEI